MGRNEDERKGGEKRRGQQKGEREAVRDLCKTCGGERETVVVLSGRVEGRRLNAGGKRARKEKLALKKRCIL